MNSLVFTLSLSDDNSRAAAEAISRCREQKINRLVLEKGEYHFYSETADETVYCISNHGHNGFKRAAFVIKDMDGFELDGNGSLLVFHGAMTPIVVLNSKHVRVKNCSIRFMRTLHGEFDVVNVTDEYVDITPHGEQGYRYDWGLLYLTNEENTQNLVYSANEFDGIAPVRDVGEQCFGKDFLYLKNEEIAPGIVRIYNPPRSPRRSVILIAAERYGSGVAILNSEDVIVENVCIHSCYGIGFHAQLSKNVTIENCRTQAYPGTCFSANADATHFVSCRGQVTIRDCIFESQLDDAINVHGVYTTVFKKEANSIIVKFEHYQCRGLVTFEKGCHLNILDRKTMVPYKENLTVTDFEVLNTECTRLYVDGDLSNIQEGDIADSIDFYPEVLIEGNEFRPNRARGILMGSRKKVIIRNNYFHTAGTAIKLESDCAYWYESGCVQDMLVENNVFDDCMYVNSDTWGSYVVHVQPRDGADPDKYYHGKVVFRNNDFSTSNKKLFDVGYAEEFRLENNKLPEDAELHFAHCGKEIVDNKSITK